MSTPEQEPPEWFRSIRNKVFLGGWIAAFVLGGVVWADQKLALSDLSDAFEVMQEAGQERDKAIQELALEVTKLVTMEQNDRALIDKNARDIERLQESGN